MTRRTALTIIVALVCAAATIPLAQSIAASQARIAAIDAERAALDPRPGLTAAACGGKCVITNSPGGYVDQFMDAAQQIIDDRQLLVIDGTCVSACTLMADAVATGGRMCVTDRAFFWLHQGHRERPDGRWEYEDTPMSDALRRLVDAKGGLPRGGFVRLGPDELATIYPRCGDGLGAGSLLAWAA